MVIDNSTIIDELAIAPVPHFRRGGPWTFLSTRSSSSGGPDERDRSKKIGLRSPPGPLYKYGRRAILVMYRTLELKLLLDDDQRMALLRTMEEYTRAFDLSARWGYANRTSNKYVHQRETYHMLRKEGFMSWIVQSAKDTACEALKQCKLRSVPKRREHSSIRYPWRVAKVYFDSGMVSISSVDGRLHVRTIVPQYFREKYGDWTAKMSILRYDKVTRTFYLGVVVEKKAAPPQMKGDVLGIRSWVEEHRCLLQQRVL